MAGFEKSGRGSLAEELGNRFLVDHDQTYPQEMEAKEISASLTFLAFGEKFSASPITMCSMPFKAL
jgi:hypothetical protein